MLQLRGKSYLAFEFRPTVPVMDWLVTVDDMLDKSPEFFGTRPVVLNLCSLDLSPSAILHLVSKLDERKIRVMGLEGVEPSKLTSNLPPLLNNGRQCAIETQPQVKAPEKPTSLFLKSPVRSGQSVVHLDGDITILGSVGSGAEIVAGGSIHIYGTLRGRAMAGVNGDGSARIFCQKMEAELVAIDGFYQTADAIDATSLSGPVQATLEGNLIKFTPLS